MIKGIGPAYASKLVKAFGDKVFTVIEEDPERLKTVSGIGPCRREKIIAGWATQRAVRDIMLFLHSHGISTARAVRIFKTYGDRAVDLIRQNPYRLAQDIHGIGFLSADKIAMSLGIEKTSLIRGRAGISYALSKAMDEGHCGLPTTVLLTSCQALLDVEGVIVSQALSLELQQGNVIKDTIKTLECVFLAGLYAAERGIANRLLALSHGPLPWPKIDEEKAIAWVQENHSIALSESQKKALEKALQSKVMIITGGPGVGKTTLLRSLLKIVQEKHINILLAAPTGRAAKRLEETTGLKARTIHRLLETNLATGGVSKNEQNPLVCDLVVVDEVSMLDVPLFYSLLKAIPPKSALLLVGDADQLPSVGPGQVLADMIYSNGLPCIHLTEVFRQAASSKIISVAHTINRGVLPQLEGYGLDSDFFFLEANEPEEALNLIVDLTTRRLPEKLGLDPLSDIQILSPMARGMVGARTLNIELQKAMNPPNDHSLQKFGWNFSVMDKAMQIQNNYQKDVYNGDIGIIKHIDKEEGELIITFDGRDIGYDIHDLDEIVLSYAMTIHKSQGSEYPAVIIPLMTQHYPMPEAFWHIEKNWYRLLADGSFDELLLPISEDYIVSGSVYFKEEEVESFLKNNAQILPYINDHENRESWEKLFNPNKPWLKLMNELALSLSDEEIKTKTKKELIRDIEKKVNSSGLAATQIKLESIATFLRSPEQEEGTTWRNKIKSENKAI